MRSQLRRSTRSMIYVVLIAVTATQLRAIASQKGQCAQLRRSTKKRGDMGLFEQSKTGDNTRDKIFATLSRYGINPNEFHIIYVTDNGSNLVCGLSKYCFSQNFIL